MTQECTCGGRNETCSFCDGRGLIPDRRTAPPSRGSTANRLSRSTKGEAGFKKAPARKLTRLFTCSRCEKTFPGLGYAKHIRDAQCVMEKSARLSRLSTIDPTQTAAHGQSHSRAPKRRVNPAAVWALIKKSPIAPEPLRQDRVVPKATASPQGRRKARKGQQQKKKSKKKVLFRAAGKNAGTGIDRFTTSDNPLPVSRLPRVKPKNKTKSNTEPRKNGARRKSKKRKKSTDALDRRLPGSYGTSKRR
jgi:hypothetical protein